MDSAVLAAPEAGIDPLLGAMSLEEQVALLAGVDSWTTVPIEHLGIPAIKVTDGPNGADVLHSLSLWERAGVRVAFGPLRSPHPRFARPLP